MLFELQHALNFVKGLREGDDALAFTSAFLLTEDDGLAKTAVLPEISYTDAERADAVDALLARITVAGYSENYGILIPQVLGLALDYIEDLALASAEHDHTQADRESLEQGKDQDVAGQGVSCSSCGNDGGGCTCG